MSMSVSDWMKLAQWYESQTGTPSSHYAEVASGIQEINPQNRIRLTRYGYLQIHMLWRKAPEATQGQEHQPKDAASVVVDFVEEERPKKRRRKRRARKNQSEEQEEDEDEEEQALMEEQEKNRKAVLKRGAILWTHRMNLLVQERIKLFAAVVELLS